MTTFQKFKRSSHDRSQCSRISQQTPQSHSDLFTLSFSSNQVLFHYSELQRVLVSTPLIVTNLSTQSIYFKIGSNKPQYYEVLPQQEILHPSATVRIVFKLRKDRILVNSTERHADNFGILQEIISRNLFQVQWTLIKQEEIKLNVIPQLKYSQTLTVAMNQQGSHPNHSKQSQSLIQRQPQNVIQREGQLREGQWRSGKKQFLKEVGSRDFELNLQDEIGDDGQSLLRLPIIIVVAALSFFVGYISA